jgi:hypothetical protein
MINELPFAAQNLKDSREKEKQNRAAAGAGRETNLGSAPFVPGEYSPQNRH